MKKKIASTALLSLMLACCQSKSSSDKPGSSGNGTSNLCASQSETICTMQFMPAQCEITLDGTQLKASGSNSCTARANLIKQICEKQSNFTQEQSETIQCTLE